MDSSAVPLTSEQQMNIFRLRDKMSLLNAEFLKVLQGFFSEKKHYDFTDTMRSYMKHVKELKAMYNVDQEEASSEKVSKKSTATSARGVAAAAAPAPAIAPPSQRKIARAVRKNGPGNTDSPKPINSTIFAASSPANVPSIPKFGDISVIAKETPAQLAPVSKLAEPSAVPAPAAARKRAIRGGGPLGGSESVVFKGPDGEEVAKTTSTVKIPATTIKFPEPSKDFWNKPASSSTTAAKESGNAGSLFAFLGKDSKSSEPVKFSGFSFGKKDEKDKKDEKNDEAAPEEEVEEEEPVVVNVSPTRIPELEPTTNASSSKVPLFGSITASSASSIPLFGTTNTSPKTSLFGNQSKPSIFGKPAENKKDDAPLTFGSSLFGGSSTSTAPAAAPTLTFGSGPSAFGSGGSMFAGLSQRAAENQARADEEEAEYVPPKAETVENEEPDAIFSSKVAVFKFAGKEYTKLGVGMLHIKNTDGKHSLLIRAATATGTVWLNALCNATMKATQTDKPDRVRLTCPTSMTEMTTMMIRFSTADLVKKFTDKIDELSK